MKMKLICFTWLAVVAFNWQVSDSAVIEDAVRSVSSAIRPGRNRTNQERPSSGISDWVSSTLQDFGSAVRETVLSSVSEEDLDPDSALANTTFILYRSGSSQSDRGVIVNRASDIQGTLDGPVCFLIHGYTQSAQNSDFLALKNALVSRRNCHVFMVDWRRGALQLYPVSAALTRPVGINVGRMVQELVGEGKASLQNIHLIGFSLGAHISGFAGKELMANNMRLQRISALDPFLPLFLTSPPEDRLAVSDANYIDVIHTSISGLQEPLGTVDYYPNGGQYQTGCLRINVLCNHLRAVQLYTESALGSCTFASRPFSENGNNRRQRRQQNQECTQNCGRMGYDSILTDARGRQYLETTGSPPFCERPTGRRNSQK